MGGRSLAWEAGLVGTGERTAVAERLMILGGGISMDSGRCFRVLGTRTGLGDEGVGGRVGGREG